MRQAFATFALVCAVAFGVALWYWVNGSQSTLPSPELPNPQVEQADIAVPPPPPMHRENFTLVEPLFQAAAAGDIYAVRSYLDSGAPLNEVGQDGMTPLVVAAKNGNTHVAVSLLEAGADTSLRDALGNSAVHLAAAADELYTLDTLYTRGVPLLVRNDEDFTPLHSASEVGALQSILFMCQLTHIDFATPPTDNPLPVPMQIAGFGKQFDALKVFINMGYTYRMREAVGFGDLESLKKIYSVDPLQIGDTQENTRLTPLLLAVSLNHEEIVKFLIEKGSDLDASADGNYDAMGLAILKNLPNMMHILLDAGYNINSAAITEYFDTPLQFAVRIGNDEAMRILLENNADINALGGKGLSVLHVATLEQRLDMAKLLLEKGADVNSKDNYCDENDDGCQSYGNTPLQLAISEKLPEFVALFMENGANLNAQRRDGQSPLHLAAFAGDEGYVKLLLDKQADPHLADIKGFTALHVAAEHDNEKILNMLLDAGADIEAKDSEGRRPLHLAASLGKEKIAKILLERGADIEGLDYLDKTPLYASLESSQTAVAKLLLEHDAKSDAISREQRTLLFPAVQNSMTDEIALLLEKGLDINHVDHQGVTPLHVAAQAATIETLKYLLEHGANPNVKDRFSQTPLHFAADRGFTVFIRELLLAGADVRAETRWGQFPIHRSALSGHWGAIHYFLIADTSLTINTTDAKGNTPLHMALQSGMPSLVEIMIENGADILKENERGFSPLSSVSMLRYATIHPQDNVRVELKKREGYKIMTDFLRAALYDRLRAAVYAGNLEEVDTYLTREPELLNVMVNGECPLHLAARLGNFEMVKKLVELGAKPFFKSHTAKPATPVELAVAGGYAEIAEYLEGLAGAA